MRRFLLLTLLQMITVGVSAQDAKLEVVSSTGGTFQLKSMQLDWTVGELAILSIQNDSQLVTQGFHQPYLIVTSIGAFDASIGNIRVYPNPTSETLEVDFEFNNSHLVTMRLVDAKGEVVLSKEVLGHVTKETMDVEWLPRGIYFLNFLLDNHLYSKTIKVLKTN